MHEENIMLYIDVIVICIIHKYQNFRSNFRSCFQLKIDLLKLAAIEKFTKNKKL